MGGELKLTPICVHFILVEAVLPVSASDRFVFNLNICGWQVTARSHEPVSNGGQKENCQEAKLKDKLRLNEKKFVANGGRGSK